MIENLPKPLSKEETYKLFEEFKNGNEKAKEILIMHNMRLVINIVKQNQTTNNEFNEELVSIGTIGLINAVNNFDTKYNLEFSTYATPWIVNAIKTELKKERKKNSLVSLDIPITNNEESKPITLIESLISEDLPIEELIIKKIDDKKTKELLRKVFPRIPEISKKIIFLYYNKSYTQQEIANQLNMPRTTVSNNLKKGLNRLKKEIEKENTKERVKKLQNKTTNH